MLAQAQRCREVPVQRVGAASDASALDQLACEEPLEIRVAYRDAGKPCERSIAITMRTPGDDAELATGYLVTEGILRRRSQLRSVAGRDATPTVCVELGDDVRLDLARLERHFYATSSCGVCGKSSLDAVIVPEVAAIDGTFRIQQATVVRLPERLRAAQPVFERTGGLHAAALFTGTGELIAVREDVGRHNAVDKVIGSRFIAGQVPIHDAVLLVSGRASFELVQKALVAGIPMLAAVGAPSSLAVELAQRFGMSLIGFVRDERFNIYSGAERVVADRAMMQRAVPL